MFYHYALCTKQASLSCDAGPLEDVAQIIVTASSFQVAPQWQKNISKGAFLFDCFYFCLFGCSNIMMNEYACCDFNSVEDVVQIIVTAFSFQVVPQWQNFNSGGTFMHLHPAFS